MTYDLDKYRGAKVLIGSKLIHVKDLWLGDLENVGDVIYLFIIKLFFT